MNRSFFDRWVGEFCLLVLALVCAGVAQAQSGTRVTPCHAATPNNAICLLWTAPETNVDGTPTVLPLTYRVEHRVGTGAWATIVTSTSARQHYATSLAIGRHEFRVYVNCPGCLESAASNVGARDATAPPIIPNPPALQVVQVVIGMDHAPVYLLTQSGQRDQRYKDACGYIEVGSACEGPVVYTFRQARFRRVSEADVKPWGASCSGFVVAPCS